MWIESLKSYYLQGLANQLSKVFVDAKKVMIEIIYSNCEYSRTDWCH